MVILGFGGQEGHMSAQEPPRSAREHPGAPRKVPHPSKSQKFQFSKRALKGNLERSFYDDFGFFSKIDPQYTTTRLVDQCSSGPTNYRQLQQSTIFSQTRFSLHSDQTCRLLQQRRDYSQTTLVCDDVSQTRFSLHNDPWPDYLQTKVVGARSTCRHIQQADVFRPRN